MKYDVIIGMEIHAQLKTKSKMFCNTSNNGENMAPNTAICEVCTGQPGTLPVINMQAIEWTVLTGLALDCQIAEQTKFDRKNYFYPDLPKGYQISQYDQPISFDGFLEINEQKIKVIRIHLEEDTGKLLHPENTNYSLVDYNRAGTPLMELVTAPDIKSAETAKKFCQEYQKILRYLDVSDANMEKGQMRCEANISLQEKGAWERKGDEIVPKKGCKLNAKIELKNINSFKAMERAVNYEIKRQTKVLDEGGELLQETRGWNDASGKTYHQRIKESAHDYRYFPEPDLPPLDLKETKEKIKKDLPELPQEKVKRFVEEYGFIKTNAELIAENKDLANYVEKVISELKAWLVSLPEVEGSNDEIFEQNKKKIAKLVSNWLINKLGGLMRNGDDLKSKITPENFAEFLTLIHQNKINATSGMKILEIMFNKGEDPSQILEEGDFDQIEDNSVLDKAIKKAIADNPKAVEEYKGGKLNAIQFLVGQVMKETKGKAQPQTVKGILEDKLK
ncbi:Asp-tRNA(Asn)/Glu-tRNA(Gln) amidotransferase subunit GatB [Candidatus Falkowbacteria bacterium]|jgi:aspartyl-tRNA(Asn)/glutamyl-tRNA(Gln) amidotransferase subunit B|nr:Asp-tRNA(Asn)/Glu-tRNA(Gln) amidotransferase subunit GatB [Candidatus Falkowbacteria bacterium]MBT4432756.1 Asp-tRNA(Asn)/Glu-tRNA(Gln) amidotransferase subunit GatB [Candidatus Falkowbacteria bacterium]